LTAAYSVSPIDSLSSSATVPLKRVAVFVATTWELKAVQAGFPAGAKRHIEGTSVWVCPAGSREYWIVRTGMGLENAKQAALRVLAHQPFCLAVSTGFACALIAVEVGTLLTGYDVVLARGQGTEVSPKVAVPGDEREAVVQLVKDEESSAHVGRFVSTDRVVGRAAEKQQLAKVADAIGLDMESAALAAEAQRAQVPFVIVRTASDLLDEDLPLDFNLFLRPTGWLKGVAAILGHPSSIMGLRRLHCQSQVAAKNLTTFFQRYAAAISARDARGMLPADKGS
jgi:adenosylhomocysteine nucleosidase